MISRFGFESPWGLRLSSGDSGREAMGVERIDYSSDEEYQQDCFMEQEIYEQWAYEDSCREEMEYEDYCREEMEKEMNPIKVFIKDESGKTLNNRDMFICSECLTLYQGEDFAKKCCSCYICGEKVERDEGGSHSECRKKRSIEREKRIFEKSEKVTDWDGWVYCEGLGNEYFEDLGLLKEYIEEEIENDKDFTRPKYVYATKRTLLSKVNIENIIESVCENSYKDAEDDLKGLDELQKALDDFNKANEHIVTYWPDCKKAILI